MKTLSEYAQMVNDRLDHVFPQMAENSFREGEMPELLARSMNYSLLAGGKRLRPSMVLAAMDMLGCNYRQWLDFACAVEMIHSYSLIHDDLPGMDNDTMRRGRPTNHVVFGEGQAILAGDGLLNYAFETMLRCGMARPAQSAEYLAAIAEVACGSGVTGMIAGQVMDLYCEQQQVMDERALSYIQRNKTACMFIYPLRAAGRLCGAAESQMEALTAYGRAFGLLFQATDDLLDVVGSSEDMGKTLGKDAANGKLTCVSAYGIEGTQKLVSEQHRIAVDAIGEFGEDAAFFVELVDSMLKRTH